jgi:hypothetical protein
MFLLLLCFPLANALSVHHRLFHPKASPFEYAVRAQLSTDSVEPFSSSFSDDISQQIRHLQELNLDLDSAFYHVALQRDGDQSDTQWDVSSVKLVCLWHVVLHSLLNIVFSVTSFTLPQIQLFYAPKERMSTP